MNLLLDKLPQSVEIDGKSYPIRTDFRTWIKYEEMLCDKDLNFVSLAAQILILCFIAPDLPKNVPLALRALSDFYHKGENGESGGISRKKCERIYSFSKDADFIYAAFYQQYGIDLTRAELHWWKFRSLFSSLSEDTKMREIMAVRSIDLSKVNDTEMKKRYRALKELYSLEEEKGEEIGEDLGEALWMC